MARSTFDQGRAPAPVGNLGERPPFVFDQVLWRGVLHLIVVAPNRGLRAYGVEMSCEIYAGFEEMICSVADRGARSNMWSICDPVPTHAKLPDHQHICERRCTSFGLITTNSCGASREVLALIARGPSSLTRPRDPADSTRDGSSEAFEEMINGE